jgi:hypothetical protein
VAIRCLERGGTYPEGSSVVGHLHLVDPPLFPFCFSFSFFGSVFAVALALCFVSRLVVISRGCYINVVGRRSVSRKHEGREELHERRKDTQLVKLIWGQVDICAIGAADVPQDSSQWYPT